MTSSSPPRSPYAAWLAGGLVSAADLALSNPAALGAGADMIGLGGGQPASEEYPLAALERAFALAIREEGRALLPYGPAEGIPALRELVAERLRSRGIDVDARRVIILTGSMQGLHLLGRITLDQGDTIVTEAPTFMGALPAWEDREPHYLTVPVDADGIDVDAFAAALRASPRRPRFVYLLPTFQNPSGVSASLARRQALLDLAAEHDLLLLEDDPYGEFWFDAGTGQVPPIRALPGAAERVIYLGTFSKILAPGIRLAYAVAPPEMLDVLARAKRGVDFHTDNLLQQAVVHLIRDVEFDLDAHIATGRNLYRARRDAMLDALEVTFGAKAQWTRPAGGFFLWLDLPPGLSGVDVAAAAQQEGVAVFPGEYFFPNADGGTGAVRLSFANATPERIREGIARLQRGIDSLDLGPLRAR